MYYPKFIVSNQAEKSISIYKGLTCKIQVISMYSKILKIQTPNVQILANWNLISGTMDLDKRIYLCTILINVYIPYVLGA